MNQQSIRVEPAGYANSLYCNSFSEFGLPYFLPLSGGWLLERRISDSDHVDAMGCYPLFACVDWLALVIDLEDIREEFVSVVLVTDPFGNYSEEVLCRAFPDLTRPFKDHFVIDLERFNAKFVHPHHQRKVRRAREVIEVEPCDDPAIFLPEWNALYANLIARHDIRGIPRFSEQSFAEQARVPGLAVTRAVHDGQVVGMNWWFVCDGIGYYHLGAYSDRGYQLGASFALFDRAIDLFQGQGLRWLDLGAGAGLKADAQDGLSRFKRGWANTTRSSYLCGRIFDQTAYQQLVAAANVPHTKYFPAYRSGEFA